MAIDSEVAVHFGDVQALGTVVWVRNIERGLHMSPDEASPLIQALLPEIC